MSAKSMIKAFIVLCITAILAVAVCGCEDLGAYENTQEYYASFGEVVLISGAKGEKTYCLVEESLYNQESRKNFMAGEDNAEYRIAYSDYVYMAIPVQSNINMDTLSLFLQSQNDVTVYINAFVTDADGWQVIEEKERIPEESKDEIVYDDLASQESIGEITVHLKNGKWSSFTLDTFTVGEQTQKSIQIENKQYIVLQIKNNSGPELPKAEITMTNLLIRALDVTVAGEAQGGE